MAITQQRLERGVRLAQQRCLAPGLGFEHAVVAFIVAHTGYLCDARGRRWSLSLLCCFRQRNARDIVQEVVYYTLQLLGRCELDSQREREDVVGQIEFGRVKIEVARRDVEFARLVGGHNVSPVLGREQVGAEDTLVWTAQVRVRRWAGFEVAVYLGWVAEVSRWTTPGEVLWERRGRGEGWVHDPARTYCQAWGASDGYCLR
jgi:hypothetical protein